MYPSQYLNPVRRLPHNSGGDLEKETKKKFVDHTDSMPYYSDGDLEETQKQPYTRAIT